MAERKTLRPVPADFVEFQHTRPTAEIAAHYVTSTRIVNRWLKETGANRNFVRKPAPVKAPPVPADFAKHAAVESKAALCARYEVAHKRLNAWLAIVGITPPVWRAEPGKPRNRKPSSATRSIGFRVGALPPVSDRRVVTSIYEEARDYLATAMRCPVYRCDFPNGTPNATGHYWRMGAVVVSPDDLLERAKVKGFGKPYRIAA